MTSPNLRRLLRLAAFLISLIPAETRACQCSGDDPSKSPLQLAKQYADGSTVIFEGTPIKVQIWWNFINTKNGTFVPASLGEYEKVRRLGPHMVVTFRVQKVYKGQPGAEIQLHTGFGGGDCGARFSSGETYLFFVSPQADGSYGVSMCSHGGPSLLPKVQSELRYLRGEAPIPEDRALPKRWSAEDTAREIDQNKKDSAKMDAILAARAGKICGRIERQDGKRHLKSGEVRFLSSLGYSPVDQPTAWVKEDGTFCSPYLGPGKYKPRFQHGEDLAYFPSTSNWGEAETLEIAAGQTLSDIVIKSIHNERFSVSGTISIENESDLAGANVQVALICVDAVGPGFGHTKPVTPVGLFGKRFFLFSNVLPGRYVAIANVPREGWLSTKVDFTVTSGSQFISLEAKPNK